MDETLKQRDNIYIFSTLTRRVCVCVCRRLTVFVMYQMELQLGIAAERGMKNSKDIGGEEAGRLL